MKLQISFIGVANLFRTDVLYACKQVYKSNSGATSFIGVANLFATLKYDSCKQVYKSNSGATSFIGVANLFATLTLSFLQTSLQVQ